MTLNSSRKRKKNKKILKYLKARERYYAKRRTSRWRNRKKNALTSGHSWRENGKRGVQKSVISLSAPKYFRLLSNTNEVLKYFYEAEKRLKKGNSVIIDISQVDDLTSETVALLAANIKDPDFTHGSLVHGNAPVKPELKKLFTESGFYGHVNAYGFYTSSKKNLLHKEVHHRVEPEIAKEACLIGMRHVFGNENPFEPLYEILIECMSNTNDHASLKYSGKCKWWLYVYCNPKKKIASYSFFDLGVGIFGSAIVQNHIQKLIKTVGLYKNINLVGDLLAGKIQSRVERDNEIRGKGLPQIVSHSKLKCFKEFYIISNDVKINLKTGQSEQLEYSLKGTMLHFDLQSQKNL